MDHKGRYNKVAPTHCPVCERYARLLVKECYTHEVKTGLEMQEEMQRLREVQTYSVMRSVPPEEEGKLKPGDATGWNWMPTMDMAWRFKEPCHSFAVESDVRLAASAYQNQHERDRAKLDSYKDIDKTYGKYLGAGLGKGAFIDMVEKRIQAAEVRFYRQLNEAVEAQCQKPLETWYSGYDVLPVAHMVGVKEGQLVALQPVAPKPEPVKEPSKPEPIRMARTMMGRPHLDPLCACKSCKSYDHP